jgi:ADP-heptose:LPS heptosyltransferase
VGEALVANGHRVIVTGPADDLVARRLAAAVTGAVDMVGATSLPQLAGVLADAGAVCVGNTGVMHLAAAAGTPVVAVFPPTVPVSRWRPWRVPHVVLGNHDVPCSPCYLRTCPYPDQPCADIDPADVVAAVDRLTPAREPDVRVGVTA